MVRASKLLVVALVVAFSCRFPKFKNPNEKEIEIPTNAVVFNEIDNVATLSVNGQQVFESKELLRANDDPVIIDLKPHVRLGANSIEIVLIDTPGGGCLSNEWAINFDLYGNGELHDYWQQRNEAGDECKEGVKVVKEYTLEVQSL